MQSVVQRMRTALIVARKAIKAHGGLLADVALPVVDSAIALPDPCGNAAALHAVVSKWASFPIPEAQYCGLDDFLLAMMEEMQGDMKEALAAPARVCDLIDAPVEVIKDAWDDSFAKRCGSFTEDERGIILATAHSIIEVNYGPPQYDGADAANERKGGNE